MMTRDGPEFSPLKPRAQPLVPLGPNSIVVGSESEVALATFENGPSDDASRGDPAATVQ